MTLKRFFLLALIAGLSLFWMLSEPRRSAPISNDRNGDAVAGRDVFNAAGCAGCHAAPNTTGDERLILAGGQHFPSPFGTFVAPNISTDPKAGIGSWSLQDFVHAVRDGISPDGRHYYPAFPYNSYHYMTDQDIVDLWAFWQELPASQSPSLSHDLPIFAQWRRPIGFWKTLYFPTPWIESTTETAAQERGHYLVQALGHCAECHTERSVLGGLKTKAWMQGATSPDGKGPVPSIAADKLGWSAQDIAQYLRSGFTPDYDVAGGLMAEVIENTSKLPEKDLLAIGKYLAGLK